MSIFELYIVKLKVSPKILPEGTQKQPKRLQQDPKSLPEPWKGSRSAPKAVQTLPKRFPEAVHKLSRKNISKDTKFKYFNFKFWSFEFHDFW